MVSQSLCARVALSPVALADYLTPTASQLEHPPLLCTQAIHRRRLFVFVLIVWLLVVL